MSGNNPVEIVVIFIADFPISIQVKNEFTTSVHLPKSQIEFDGNYSELKQGDVIELSVPQWLLEANDLV